MRNLHSHGRLAFGASLAQNGKGRKGLGVNLRNQKVLAATILLPNLADLDLFRGHSTTLDTIKRSVNNRPRLCFAPATSRSQPLQPIPLVIPRSVATRNLSSALYQGVPEGTEPSVQAFLMDELEAVPFPGGDHGRPLPHFDALLPRHDRRLAHRRSGISRHPSPHCADVSAVDRHRAWRS